MSAVASTANENWQAEAIDLKRQGLVSNDIAEAVGKSASTVRKVIARAREAGDLPAEFAVVDPPKVPDLMKALEESLSPIEGQTTVDDHLRETDDSAIIDNPEFEVPPEDDPEYTVESWGDPDPEPPRDPLEDFRAEAGPAVGPMPEREMDGGVTVEHRLAGTRQMALDLGPNAAPVTGATIQFKSLKHESGHFGMGDIVTGTFTARVVGIPAKEAFDKDSEEYRAKPIAYVAEITEFEYEAAEASE